MKIRHLTLIMALASLSTVAFAQNDTKIATGYVGNTTVTTKGRIERAGTPTGIESANALCADQYGATAHMCAVAEIYQSIATGKISQAKSMENAWVWSGDIAVDSVNKSSGSNANRGFDNNCAGYSYPTADQAWKGMTANYKYNADRAAAVLELRSGTNAACWQQNAISCCL